MEQQANFCVYCAQKSMRKITEVMHRTYEKLRYSVSRRIVKLHIMRQTIIFAESFDEPGGKGGGVRLLKYVICFPVYFFRWLAYGLRISSKARVTAGTRWAGISLRNFAFLGEICLLPTASYRVRSSVWLWSSQGIIRKSGTWPVGITSSQCCLVLLDGH